MVVMTPLTPLPAVRAMDRTTINRPMVNVIPMLIGGDERGHGAEYRKHRGSSGSVAVVVTGLRRVAVVGAVRRRRRKANCTQSDRGRSSGGNRAARQDSHGFILNRVIPS